MDADMGNEFPNGNFVPNVLLLWSFCKADFPAAFSTEEKQ